MLWSDTIVYNMNTIYIEKTVDKTWGKRTNMSAIEKLMQDNNIVITPEKVERMPDSYIMDTVDGIIQPDKK